MNLRAQKDGSKLTRIGGSNRAQEPFVLFRGIGNNPLAVQPLRGVPSQSAQLSTAVESKRQYCRTWWIGWREPAGNHLCQKEVLSWFRRWMDSANTS
jgi:hypothetical protein